MGFDYQKIPSIVRARQKSGNHRLVEEGIKPIISSNIQEYDNATVEELRQHALLCFKPTKGWKGHIELE